MSKPTDMSKQRPNAYMNHGSHPGSHLRMRIQWVGECVRFVAYSDVVRDMDITLYQTK
jgi:hypothetical protein